MTAATQSNLWAWLVGPSTQVETGPKRTPRPGPIFVQDAVMPWKDGTMLLDILRKDMSDADDTPPSD